MLKLTIACTVAMAGIVGCSSERANSSPPESPPGVDIQYNDSETSDSKSSESDTAKAAAETKTTESSKQQDSKTNVSRHEAAAETGKTKCEGLTQKKCEISDGCAWHTDKKCVSQ